MRGKVLHLLSQRPSFTGSGVSLDAVVRLAGRAGWEQRVVVGVPGDDAEPEVGGLDRGRIHPLVFFGGDLDDCARSGDKLSIGRPRGLKPAAQGPSADHQRRSIGSGPLDFALPGMSDVMPYASSRFSLLDAGQLAAYRAAWRGHVAEVVGRFRPDVIHSRHVWLLSSLVKDVAPDVPVVTQCHATGLRQMVLCPHLADEVRRGCGRNDRFLVLHQGHADALVKELEVGAERIHVVGTGYREEFFHARGRQECSASNLIYAGKYSMAKGLPQLLDAFERLVERRADLVLHVAGDGAGQEAEALRRRMAGLAPRVVMHGQLGQEALAELMRSCAVFVLPSFYEGLPLVLVEALACGCRLVCSELPSVRQGLGASLDAVVDWVAMPRLIGADVPVAADLPGFVDRLTGRIEAALDRPPLGVPRQSMGEVLETFTWEAVFGRIERVWLDLIGGGG